MEITTQPRWSGIVLCNDPSDPEHGLAQLGLMLKLCVHVRLCIWLYACKCMHVSAHYLACLTCIVYFLRSACEFWHRLWCFSMKTCALFTCSLIKHVHVLCIAFVASTVQYLYLCVGLSRSCFLS